MQTPIYNFVHRYESLRALRLHMPGHKGRKLSGFEKYDITEIDGADSLFDAKGIILESEKNASELFGCPTFYSCEGSSLCIRAMLYLLCNYAVSVGKKPLILAARNVHNSFISAAALLDFNYEWLYSNEDDSYLCCKVSTEHLDTLLSTMSEKPVAVYITSPDYLGNICDIEAISTVCHKHDVLLAVDNAHGAYLHFLTESKHPIDLGADLCCDSAHKTLPVLTGGAYLHVGKNAPESFAKNAKYALSLFASTSPSYLILQSLDAVNPYLYYGITSELTSLIFEMHTLRQKLTENGYHLVGDEEIKLTICTKPYGYSGEEFADILKKHRVFCEFYDSDFVVMMFSTGNNHPQILKIEKILLSIKKKDALLYSPPKICKTERAISIRQAIFAPFKELPVDECEGRILAFDHVSCPPAVPVVIPGERITANTIKNLKYYGIKTCKIVDNF